MRGYLVDFEHHTARKEKGNQSFNIGPTERDVLAAMSRLPKNASYKEISKYLSGTYEVSTDHIKKIVHLLKRQSRRVESD